MNGTDKLPNRLFQTITSDRCRIYILFKHMWNIKHKDNMQSTKDFQYEIIFEDINKFLQIFGYQAIFLNDSSAKEEVTRKFKKYFEWNNNNIQHIEKGRSQL